MSNFFFLDKYVLPSEKEVSNPIYSNYKHQLFPIVRGNISEVEKFIKIPKELMELYTSIGYGFFNVRNKTAFNRLFDAYSFKEINLREDFYEFDPQLDVYEFLYKGDKLLFFEIIEGNYLAIDKNEINGKNEIFHFDKKIADSLEEFLIELDENPNFLG